MQPYGSTRKASGLTAGLVTYLPKRFAKAHNLTRSFFLLFCQCRLCAWVKALLDYHEALREVRPKMDAVHAKRMELARAEKRLVQANKELLGVQKDIDSMQKQHEEAFREKQRLQVPPPGPQTSAPEP